MPRVLGINGLDDRGQVRRPFRHAVDAEPVGPRRPDPGEALFRSWPRMADRAGEPLEVDEWQARVLGIGRAEPARHDRLLARFVLAEMTAPAGERSRRPVPGFGGLAFVAADDAVAEIVPMAVGALQTGRRVDVGGGAPLGLVLGRDRVAGQTAVVRRRIAEVEEVAVLGVKVDRPVLDGRDYGPLVVVKVRAVVNVPGPFEAGSHAAHFSDAAGRSGGPTEILAEDLFGPLARILASRLVVAGEAVHFGLPGDVPARGGIDQDFPVRWLGRAAAREVPAKEHGEIPGRQPEGHGIEGPRPLPVREGQDGPRFRVEPDPGFARPAALRRGHGAEVPPALDRLVVVARSASETGRERQGVRFGRDDGLVVLVPERDEMGRRRPVAVPDGVFGILDGGRGGTGRGEGQDRERQAQGSEGVSSGAAHALNCSGRKSMTRRALTASLALSTATQDS